MFLLLSTDFNGEVTSKVTQSMIFLFGESIFKKESTGLSLEIQLHTKKAIEKVRELRERFK